MLNSAAQPRDTFGEAIIMMNDTILTIWCNLARPLRPGDCLLMSLNQLILLPLIDDLGLFIPNVFAIISHFLLHVHHVIYLQSLFQCEHLTQADFLVIHHKTEIPDCLQRTKNMFPNFSNLQKYLVITNPTWIETEHRTRLFYLARSAQTWQRDGSIKCGIC